VDESEVLAVVAVLEAAHVSGSPVAGDSAEARNAIAAAAIRRIKSADRRMKSATRADRVEDLAKGLRDRFEVEPKLAGPLVVDYRHIAEMILDTVDPAP
jgi:hypothetical protein